MPTCSGFPRAVHVRKQKGTGSSVFVPRVLLGHFNIRRILWVGFGTQVGSLDIDKAYLCPSLAEWISDMSWPSGQVRGGEAQDRSQALEGRCGREDRLFSEPPYLPCH